MFDKEKIEKKLMVIERERTLLDDSIEVSYEEFISEDNSLMYDATLHRLQVALQAVLDVSQYIVAHMVLGDYSENKKVFDLLEKEGILNSDLAEVLKGAIGVRNILVHQYEDVDPKVIFDILENHLNDFDKFISSIAKFLQDK